MNLAPNPSHNPANYQQNLYRQSRSQIIGVAFKSKLRRKGGLCAPSSGSETLLVHQGNLNRRCRRKDGQISRKSSHGPNNDPGTKPSQPPFPMAASEQTADDGREVCGQIRNQSQQDQEISQSCPESKRALAARERRGGVVDQGPSAAAPRGSPSSCFGLRFSFYLPLTASTARVKYLVLLRSTEMACSAWVSSSAPVVGASSAGSEQEASRAGGAP